MKTAIKDKHLKVKKIIGAKTETEAVEKALNFLIERDTFINKRREIMRRIICRRERLGKIKGDVADWIGEGRRGNRRVRYYEV